MVSIISHRMNTSSARVVCRSRSHVLNFNHSQSITIQFSKFQSYWFFFRPRLLPSCRLFALYRIRLEPSRGNVNEITSWMLWRAINRKQTNHKIDKANKHSSFIHTTHAHIKLNHKKNQTRSPKSKVKLTLNKRWFMTMWFGLACWN